MKKRHLTLAVSMQDKAIILIIFEPRCSSLCSLYCYLVETTSIIQHLLKCSWSKTWKASSFLSLFSPQAASNVTICGRSQICPLYLWGCLLCKSLQENAAVLSSLHLLFYILLRDSGASVSGRRVGYRVKDTVRLIPMYHRVLVVYTALTAETVYGSVLVR